MSITSGGVIWFDQQAFTLIIAHGLIGSCLADFQIHLSAEQRNTTETKYISEYSGLERQPTLSLYRILIIRFGCVFRVSENQRLGFALKACLLGGISNFSDD